LFLFYKPYFYSIDSSSKIEQGGKEVATKGVHGSTPKKLLTKPTPLYEPQKCVKQENFRHEKA